MLGESFVRSGTSNLQRFQSSSAHFLSIFRDSSNEMPTPQQFARNLYALSHSGLRGTGKHWKVVKPRIRRCEDSAGGQVDHI
jgi:hypothetical protein